MAVENASRLIQDFALALQPLGLACAVHHEHLPSSVLFSHGKGFQNDPLHLLFPEEGFQK
jgi:hypothetical protein